MKTKVLATAIAVAFLSMTASAQQKNSSQINLGEIAKQRSETLKKSLELTEEQRIEAEWMFFNRLLEEATARQKVVLEIQKAQRAQNQTTK